MVAVAQLVEPRIVIPVVAGSIPVSHPIFPLFYLDALKLRFWLSLSVLAPEFTAVAFFSEGTSCRNTFYVSFLKPRQIDSIGGRLSAAFFGSNPGGLI